MDVRWFSCSGCIPAAVVVGLLGFIVQWRAQPVHAQTSAAPDENKAETCAITDVRSRHFLVHTDLSSAEAGVFTERLEAVLGHISRYWGQPLHGVIECYIIRNLDGFPVAHTAPAGVRAVKTAGGVTLMEVATEGKRQVPKSVVYVSARLDAAQHEAVHAYCHQTFGHIGPVWYSEGMAEVGHFWKETDMAVRADLREIEFLHNNPPKSLAEPVSSSQVTGDCWQNYASRWALCHFLLSNPNYSRQFRQLGHGFLAGRDVSFEQTYAGTSRQLFFEYLFFLEHISPGYRVDLCAWDWKKKFTRLLPGQSTKITIAAGRGWQPTGLTVRPKTRYKYRAAGTWQMAGEYESLDADGDDSGRGRLVGVLMKDYQLGPEFELGARGSFQLEASGDLYLRCRNTWNELDGDVGRITVNFELGEQDSPRCPAIGDRHAGPRATCPASVCGRQ